jgi:hypothetical protein
MSEHEMLQIGEVENALCTSFDRIHVIHKSTYEDCSTVIVCPTRGAISHKIVQAWMQLISPMNQKRALMICAGAEVADAYNTMVAQVLDHPELSRWRYLMCLEDDNLVPPDAHIRLLEAMRDNPEADGVGGLYFTKGDGGLPLALGDAKRFSETGVLDFAPVNLVPAVEAGQRYVEVNGLPQGCTLFKMDIFRYVPAPWFNSFSDLTPFGAASFTQDLKFADRARRLGKRFFIDLHVKVGHLDIQSGIVY